jgi:hypothetical protein
LIEPVLVIRVVVRLSLQPGMLDAKEGVEHEGLVLRKVPCTAVDVVLW